MSQIDYKKTAETAAASLAGLGIIGRALRRLFGGNGDYGDRLSEISAKLDGLDEKTNTILRMVAEQQHALQIHTERDDERFTRLEGFFGRGNGR